MGLREEIIDPYDILYKTTVDNAILNILPIVVLDPIPWIEQNINLGLDKDSESNGFVSLDLTPYLKSPINAFASRCKKSTLIAVQQAGKSRHWQWALMWRMDQNPCSTRIIYQSDDVAQEINQKHMKPLMLGIPKLAREMSHPKSCKKDSYNFSDGYYGFQGSGKNIISNPAKIIIGDEYAFWQQPDEAVKARRVSKRTISKVSEMDHRVRSYKDSLRVLCTSPLASSGEEWKEFLKSSVGFWHLKCPCCEDLIPSHLCDIIIKKNPANKDIFDFEFNPDYLKYDLDVDGDVIEESIKLVCKNGHDTPCPASEDQQPTGSRYQMNLNGEYVHTYKKRINTHIGHQFGGIASPFLSMLEIARAIEDSKDGTRASLQNLWNSFLGLPYFIKDIAIDEKRLMFEEHLAAKPAPEDVAKLIMCVDTQDSCFVWCVLAITFSENIHVLDYGMAAREIDLQNAWDTKYYNRYCSLGIIDHGGHRSKEVEEFISGKDGWIMYKGESRQSKPFKLSENKDCLLLVKAKHYQAELLWKLYLITDKTKRYLFFPEDVDKAFINQFVCYGPPPGNKDAGYENWTHNNKPHDYFDCVKMGLVLMEFAMQTYPNWIFTAKAVKKKKRKRQ